MIEDKLYLKRIVDQTERVRLFKYAYITNEEPLHTYHMQDLVKEITLMLPDIDGRYNGLHPINLVERKFTIDYAIINNLYLQ